MHLREKFLSLLGRRNDSRPAAERYRAMAVEALEPRVLHSADAAAALLPIAPAQDGRAQAPEVRTLDVNGEFAPAANQSQHTQTEIVFVDTRTPDYQKLVDDIHAEAADGRAIEVVLLDNATDGIKQITDVLASRHDIATVHIVSHGSDGSIQLGGSTLDLQSLQSHEGQIAGWANALSSDADLLIYGCDVAASAQGRAFVDALSNVTGADVAASENLTGNAAAGGDWNLEYSTGSIGSAIAFDAATQMAWSGVLANSSPVLSGANNLPTITEDPATNPGATVATLIAGHVTDPDVGALTGIAVTATDNTNGSWQYSINAGTSWSAFTSPSDTNATLLRSTDLVRFVPNADWNGTVTNGLTFRAWDQTTGTAGSTANAISTTSNVLDNFSTVSYSNNNGSVSWSSNWVDDDGDPSGGAVLVSGGRLQLQTLLGGGDIHRSVDLTGADTATLSFSYDNQILLSLGGNIALQVSNNGGASYTTLTTFSSVSNTGATTYSADISAYISGDTRIQFVSTGLALAQSLFIDDVQISYTTPVASGLTAFSAATASSSIDVTAVDDPPVGTDNTVTTAENNPYVFTVADFGFTDPDLPPDNFTGVIITTLPTAGSLTLNGSAVTAGQSVSPGLLNAGKLQFTPDAGTSGTGYASFTFQVKSSGGGSNVDLIPRTMTVNVTGVNDPPAGTSNTISATEDGAHVFTTADFGFTDPSDSPANNLLAVKISTLPGAGSLTLLGVGVTAGQFVSATDISAGRLVFTPAADANGTGYASFTFQVQDDGGGTDLDPIARTMTVDVTAVNDPPVLVTNAGLTVNENSSAVITTAKLQVTDVDNTNTQLVFSVSTIPTHGHLELASAAGVAITSFTADDIANNQLVYVHDGSQTTSDGFSFTVSDGAGGSIGATAFAITVNAVNDAPVNSVPGAQVTAHDAPIVFSTAQGNALSVSDPDAGASAIKITLTAANGTLTLATTSGLTFAIGSGANDALMQFTGTQAAINTALDGLSFAPTAGYAGNATLSIVTNDLGNTGSGGALAASSSVAISITAPPGSTGSTPAAPPISTGTPVVPPPPTIEPPVDTAPTLPESPGSTTPITQSPGVPSPTDPAAAPNAPYEPAVGSSRYFGTDASSTRIGRFAGASYALPAAQWLMGNDDAITGIGQGSGSSIGLGGYGDARSSLQSPALLDALDRLRDGLQEQSRTEAIVVASTAAASLGLSVGYVLWLLRGGVLVSSMLSSLPAWRMVDPLPILGRLDEDEDENAEDDSLESIVASGSANTGRPVQGDAAR